jgi:hypothetical protein
MRAREVWWWLLLEAVVLGIGFGLALLVGALGGL